MADAAVMEDLAAAPPTTDERRRLLVIDAAYTLEMIKDRRAERSVLCRDLDGYFDHVWNVHPFATLLTSEAWGLRYGPPAEHQLDARHTVIEGTVGRFSALRRLSLLNFLLSQMQLWFQLWRLMRKEGIDAVRVGDPLYLGILGWTLARTTGAVFAIRVNGNYDKIRLTTGKPMFPRLFRSVALEKKIERFILPRADLVLAPNDDNAGFAVQNGVRRSAIKVVNFGSLLGDEHFVEPAKRPSADLDLPELGVRSRNFLLCVGRLEPPKFPDHVVRVLAHARTSRPELKAVFAGDGTMREELRLLARELGVEDAVVFAGNRDQQFLARVIPHAAVVLSPSTGRALSEAALGGVPIVAYDTDWQKDMIETDVTGILVPYRDYEGMAQATERFLRDQDFSAAMGAAVRKRAMVMLDPAAGIASERDSYRKLFAAREGRAG